MIILLYILLKYVYSFEHQNIPIYQINNLTHDQSNIFYQQKFCHNSSINLKNKIINMVDNWTYDQFKLLNKQTFDSNFSAKSKENLMNFTTNQKNNLKYEKYIISNQKIFYINKIINQIYHLKQTIHDVLKINTNQTNNINYLIPSIYYDPGFWLQIVLIIIFIITAYLIENTNVKTFKT